MSTPNAARLERAVEGLEFMVSMDIYVNETSRHADVILPAPDPLARSHYDIALYQFAARNVANYSPAVFEREAGLLSEEEVFLRLTGIVTGQGPDADTDAIDDTVAGALIAREVRHAVARSRAGTRPRSRRPWSRGAGPSGSSTCCFASAPTATASAPGPTG